MQVEHIASRSFTGRLQMNVIYSDEVDLRNTDITDIKTTDDSAEKELQVSDDRNKTHSSPNELKATFLFLGLCKL